MPYKVRKRGDKWGVYKEDADGNPTGEALGMHDSEEAANEQLRALYAAEGKHGALFLSMSEYVAMQPGKPYRLLPFGTIHKAGGRHEITPEVAAKFKLPHFKPAIKLGSHDEPTPSGGSIIGLEVREDGLYGVPEYTDKGLKALEDGDYRYHSPEVIWEDAGFEDPTTGKIIPGPLIIGDALLHMPHLGEAAALFETNVMEDTQMEKVKVSKTLWEQIKGLFDPQDEAPAGYTPPETPPAVDTNAAPQVVAAEKYAALEAELATLKADEKKREDERLHAALVSTVKAELASDEYGGMYVELAKVDEAAGMLAGMTPEQREWCQRTFKSYAAHVDLSRVHGELGSAGSGAVSETNALHAAIVAKMTADKISYTEAFDKMRVENPELVSAAFKQ